jgi:hypothetical protein
MTVIVCTGSRGGMLFLGRRVSRDRKILSDIATLGGRLLCHPFSEKYLRGAGLAPEVDEALLLHAERDDLCFIETLPLAPHAARIDRLIRYSFETRYPFDVSLDLDPVAAGLRLVKTEEIVGHSHQSIIKETYER